MDYLRGPSGITRVLIKERPGVSTEAEMGVVWGLEPGMQVASRN